MSILEWLDNNDDDDVIYWAWKWQNGLKLPFWALRLLKPCKVKRFLATAALSEGGLVTASSDPEKKMGQKKGEGRGWVKII